jgi:NitT/TauT family transport system substrate-binding protein
MKAPLNRRQALGTLGATALFAAPPFLRSGRAQSITKLSYQTGWLAQAEHGGLYQAQATGIYREHGIDLDIRMGGPQMNVVSLFVAGKCDFTEIDSFRMLNMAQEKLPGTAIAAFFQKDPRVLMSHPGMGNDTLASLKGKPILVATAGRQTYWQWLKAKYGFADEQIRPYTFNSAPFLVDKNAIQQGYISSEPYKIKKEAGVDTKFFLLADHGYGTYGNLVIVQRKLVDEKPAVVQGFVEASIEGWYDYLYGDPSPGNALIKKDNPDMDDGLISEGISKMRQYGIVDSGDTKELGVGAMTDARWKAFFDELVKVGGYPATLDYKRAYTTQFVNKNHAAEMRPKGAL